MRHRNHQKRLGRKPHQARSILRNLATSILLYERVRTTKKRAQVIRSLVDRIITIGKKERTDLAIRKINRMTSDPNVSRKVLEVLRKRYMKRPSGFTRIVPVGMRLGDGAQLADIILMDAVEPTPATAKEKSSKPDKKKPKS